MMIKKTGSIFLLIILVVNAVMFFSGCNTKQNEVKTQLEFNTFIKDWIILGPFPNCEDCSTTSYHHDERCAGFYTDYLKSIGGEKDAVPKDGMKVKYSEKNIERTWFKIHSTEDKIHLTYLKPKDMVVAYAFCQVESSKNQKTVLSVGSNDGLRVFLNGKEVHESHLFDGRWLQADNDFIPVEL